MASKKRSPRRSAPAAKTTSPRAPRAKVRRVIEQAREPLSLLQTLREEGLGNALTFLTMAGNLASDAARNFRAEAFAPQLRELASAVGFVTREEFERLAERVDELEQTLSERDYEALRGQEAEE